MMSRLFRHGDMLYVSSKLGTKEVEESAGGTSESGKSENKQIVQVKQDEVDDYLDQQDGLIQRKRDSQL
jgi:hypothetical protein